jgi:tetratricopeptide (TPR) repeat protein
MRLKSIKDKIMKTKYIYLSLLAALSFATTSCDKFLDVEPKGIVIPTTIEDYDALLSAPLEIGRTSNIQVYLTDDIFLPEEKRSSANSGFPGKEGVLAYDFADNIYDSNEDDQDWNIAYRTIYVSNTVIEGLKASKEQDSPEKKRVLGEALVHRAFAYLNLVNAYAKHYNSATASTDLGVPMHLEPNINALPARSTVQEVYNQIEKDLMQSIDLLPQTPKYSYRPGKAGAYGVLARMYLFMGNWANALDYANKAFAINNHIYDFNEFSWSNPSNKHWSQINGYPSATVQKKDIVLQKYLRVVGSYGTDYMFSQDLLEQYQPGDLRLEFGSVDFDYYMNPLPGKGILDTKAAYDYNHGGITTAELLLISAEALARTNKPQEAIAKINTLRRNRISAELYQELTASGAAEALEIVLKERRVELAFKGMRLYDIKRLSQEGRNVVITRGAANIAGNDPRLVLPIPSKILAMNPNIVPNQR